jgi:hypothetical protein
MKRAILYSVVFCGLAGSLLMTEGRMYAMRVYGAPCGEAPGLAGLLVKTHFLPAGTCSTACSGTCTVTNPVSGGNTQGNCVKVANTCSCVPLKK